VLQGTANVAGTGAYEALVRYCCLSVGRRVAGPIYQERSFQILGIGQAARLGLHSSEAAHCDSAPSFQVAFVALRSK